MKCVEIPDELKKMARIFSENGFEAYLVGGAVRDMLLKKKPTDWDIATNARPEQVSSIFRRVIPTGIEHGTVTVIFMNHHVEVTTYRIEVGYSDGRHPDRVHYASDIIEDLSRRDFTMNAAAASLHSGEIIDPFDARGDINNKTIRTVGSAKERFFEDGLRSVRAVRFAAQLDFTIEKNTYEAIPVALEITKKIAVERFRDEFEKILATKQPSIAFRLMEDTGLMQFFLPELLACRGVEQLGFHRFDVLDHLLYSCDAAPATNLIVRMAALFHDVGKPQTKKKDESILDGITGKKYTFYQHEAVSAKMTETILERLRFSRQIVNDTTHLVCQHMFHYEENWSSAAVRRFLVRVKAESPVSAILQNLFDLRRADLTGTVGIPAHANHLLDLRDRIDSEFEKKTALNLKSLAINGNDLINIGISSGKQIGYILNELLETVLEDPTMNTKEKLLTVAAKIAQKGDVLNHVKIKPSEVICTGSD